MSPTSRLEAQQRADEIRAFCSGVDIASLRAKYPDPSKYGIVRGLVRPGAGLDGTTPQPAGYVTDLSINDINVPKDLRKHLPETRNRYALPPSSPYEITLAIGKRLESWIKAVSSTTAP